MQPYECPLCGKLTCKGIACKECVYGDENCVKTPCECSAVDYTKYMFSQKDSLMNKDIQLLIKHNEIKELLTIITVLQQQNKQLKKFLDDLGGPYG